MSDDYSDLSNRAVEEELAALLPPRRNVIFGFGAALAMVAFGVFGVLQLANGSGTGWVIAVVFGLFSLVQIGQGIRNRMRPPEQRLAKIKAMRAKHDKSQARLDMKRLRNANRLDRGRKSLEGGRITTATIAAFEPVPTVNEQTTRALLDLDVLDRNGTTYRVQTSETIERAYVGLLQPGRQLHVLVDETDPTLLAIDWYRSSRVE